MNQREQILGESFIESPLKLSGFSLRPFTAGSEIVCRQIGITFFSDPTAKDTLSEAEYREQIYAFAWAHGEDLEKVLATVDRGGAEAVKAAVRRWAFQLEPQDLSFILSEIERIGRRFAAASFSVQDNNSKPDTPGN